MSYFPLKTIQMFMTEFEKRLGGFSVVKYSHKNLITVFVLNDSLLIWVELHGEVASPCLNAEEMYGKDRLNPYLEFPVKGKTYYQLRIAELTPNEIGFKYNNSKFVREMCELTNISLLDMCGTIEYAKYGSQTTDWWNPSGTCGPWLTNYVDSLFPQLKIHERIDAWDGNEYHFIVLEFESYDQSIVRAVAYTMQNPHSYVVRICKEWIATGKLKGTAIINGFVERNMKEAFNSWKGIKRQERLEKHLKYFFVTHRLKQKDAVFPIARKLYDDVNNGKYTAEIRSTYLRPVNKWVSEEMVYKITKALYKDCAVIYQHRPFFLLSTSGGQMSYDIFISRLNVAIEYQGKQHFEPVEFFGGREAFEKLQIRDKEKAKLSRKHGVKLVYINYWEDITPELIIERVGVLPH